MNCYNILVTGIGGNVGQGIIRNIRSLALNLKVTGTNITAFSAGNHLCDYFYKVPYASDSGYISIMNEICSERKIDLIIPSTDLESYYLSKAIDEFDIPIAVSEHETIKVCIDKYQTYLHHSEYNIPFGRCYLPSEYNFQFDECIAKPRTGRGSRGIVLNPTKFTEFNDEDYLIQEFIRGLEITTSFYVTKRNELHGYITFERTLDNGATTNCKVVNKFDKDLYQIITKLIAHNKYRGSINLQSIVTETNKIIPFEINCRISGTNSIRSQFGFEDVKYTLQELLFNTEIKKPIIKQGIATRILIDVIYPKASEYHILKDKNNNHYLY